VNELELLQKLHLNDSEMEVRELRAQFCELEQSKNSLQEKVRSVEMSKVKIIEESDRKYKEAVTNFEEEMEQKEQSLQMELREMQERSEEALV
jgi:ACT domain-containing protein